VVDERRSGGAVERDVALPDTDVATPETLTADDAEGDVCIPVPGGSHVLVDPRRHREDVVRRLLLLGVSTRTLRALLPAWSGLIVAVSDTFVLDASGRVVGAPFPAAIRRGA
jgi:hypothetical protein